MGFRPSLLVSLVVISAVVVATADGADICNVSEDELRECQAAVTAGASPPPPTAACCAGLAKADLPCFCSYRNSSLLPILGIDPDLAMQLPAKCGLPPPDEC